MLTQGTTKTPKFPFKERIMKGELPPGIKRPVFTFGLWFYLRKVNRIMNKFEIEKIHNLNRQEMTILLDKLSELKEGVNIIAKIIESKNIYLGPRNAALLASAINGIYTMLNLVKDNLKWEKSRINNLAKHKAFENIDILKVYLDSILSINQNKYTYHFLCNSGLEEMFVKKFEGKVKKLLRDIKRKESIYRHTLTGAILLLIPIEYFKLGSIYSISMSVFGFGALLGLSYYMIKEGIVQESLDKNRVKQ